jgi:hypothetical protein
MTVKRIIALGATGLFVAAGAAQGRGWQGVFAGRKNLTSNRNSKSVRFTLFLSEIWPIY